MPKTASESGQTVPQNTFPISDPFRSSPRPNKPDEKRLPAVPLDDSSPFDTIREFYHYQEPALLGAIRLGNRNEARRVINHLLVHSYAAEQERSKLLKGLLLELVVMMSQAAVDLALSLTETH